MTALLKELYLGWSGTEANVDFTAQHSGDVDAKVPTPGTQLFAEIQCYDFHENSTDKPTATDCPRSTTDATARR
jgi:hypothetical protein